MAEIARTGEILGTDSAQSFLKNFPVTYFGQFFVEAVPVIQNDSRVLISIADTEGSVFTDGHLQNTLKQIDNAAKVVSRKGYFSRTLASSRLMPGTDNKYIQYCCVYEFLDVPPKPHLNIGW